MTATITQTGRLTDAGKLQSTDGYLYRWATIDVPTQGARGPVRFRVLVQGDAAATLDVITRNGGTPTIVFSGLYTLDASSIGLSQTDESFGVGGASAVPPWE